MGFMPQATTDQERLFGQSAGDPFHFKIRTTTGCKQMWLEKKRYNWTLEYGFQSELQLQEPRMRELVLSGKVLCGAHVFEGFFGLENGPVKSNKSQEKTLLAKIFPSRQDTVVGVFPMESSN